MVLNIRYECGVAGCPHTYWPATIGIRVRGDRGAVAPPQIWAKPLFFGQKLHFSGRSQQHKNEKNIFLHLLNKKNNKIHSV